MSLLQLATHPSLLESKYVVPHFVQIDAESHKMQSDRLAPILHLMHVLLVGSEASSYILGSII